MASGKTYVFPIAINCGPGDSGDAEIQCKLTAEEAERLEAAAPGFRLEEAESIADIYDKVYQKADRELTKQLWKDDPDSAEEMAEEWAEDNDEEPKKWTVGEYWTIIVNFPEELQDKGHAEEQA